MIFKCIQVSKLRRHLDLGEIPKPIPQNTLLTDSPHPSKHQINITYYWHYHLLSLAITFLSLSGDICVHWIPACGESNRGGAFRPENLLRSGECLSFPSFLLQSGESLSLHLFESLSFLRSDEFINTFSFASLSASNSLLQLSLFPSMYVPEGRI